ncbi:hypothetical protein [Haloferax denitrificans]|uniref:hypothetical protein n=1 Tax=Haloferax denitrificans TaxID=35745 RepID=UPI003C6F28D4
MNQGIVYIGTDEEYINNATFSARITKRAMDVPITLVSDREVTDDVFDDVVIDKSPQRSFSDKPRNLLRTPYEKTLYLDTDVFLLRDISEIFDVLDQFDVAAAVDPNEWELRYDCRVDYGEIPESFPIYQTGVLAFRKGDAITELFNHWKKIHMQERIKRDQASFRIAMYESNARMTALSSVYNCLLGWPMQVTGEVKVVHDTLGMINDYSDVESVDAALNDSTSPRILYNIGDEVHMPLYKNTDALLRGIHQLGRKLLR